MKQYHLLPLSLAFLAQGLSEDFSEESIPLYFLSAGELQEEDSFASSAVALDETLLNSSLSPENESNNSPEALTALSIQQDNDLLAYNSRQDYDNETDEDEDEEGDEEEEEDNTSYAPPPKKQAAQKRVAAVAPSNKAQGPQGSLKQQRQERAARIQQQRAQRLHAAKMQEASQEQSIAQSDELSEEIDAPVKNRPSAKTQRATPPKRMAQRPQKTARATTDQSISSEAQVAAVEPDSPSNQTKQSPQNQRSTTTRQNMRKSGNQKRISQNNTPSGTNPNNSNPNPTGDSTPPQTPSPQATPRSSPPPQSPKGPPSDKSYKRSSPTSQARPAIRRRGAIAQTSKRPNIAYGTQPKKVESNENTPPAPSRMTAPEAVNLTARPVVKNNCLWFDGEAIFWQAYEENLEFAYKGNTSPEEWDIKSPDFDWNWGWRVGMGYNLPHDQWDLGLEWLHVNNFARGKAQVNPSSDDEPLLYNVWTTASASLTGGTEAKSHWENYLNQVDLNMGRQFYVGRWLSLRPHAGLRSTWIFQKYKVDFDGLFLGVPTNADTHMTNRYWGLGFCAGLGSDWMLGKGFSIYGDAGLALLVGFFNVHQHGEENDVDAFKISKGFRTGRPIFDLDLGLKWFSRFNKDRYAFTIKAGYEYHLYSNMNQFLQSNGSADLELFNPVTGDLSYQGITVGGRFDF